MSAGHLRAGGLIRSAQSGFSATDTALPVALRKNMGVTAMKIFAQEQLKAPAKDLIRYSLSLPVTACVVGMPKVEFIEENIAIAKAFKPLGREEMQRISGELVPAHKATIDRFFADHIDA